jgi:hypothetical protein
MKIDFLFVCTEGWETMKPTEKGAFCEVCQKEVIDFSQKKIGEIRALANEHKEGELCGRLKPKQVLELNFSSFFKKFLLWNLRKRIAVIFFFILGSMLFSCSSFNGGREHEHLAGIVAIEDSSSFNRPDTTLSTPNGQK